MTTAPSRADGSRHILNDLGFEVREAGDELRGSAPVVPEMFVPATTCIRTSILATWVDVVAGLLAVNVFAPRIPVTLDLDVHLYGRPREVARIDATARLMKKGRSVVVVAVALTDERGQDVALGTASFMATPDPAKTMPPEMMGVHALPRQRGRLSVPFAERARCTVREPGVAVLTRSDDGMNAGNTVQGGLIALSVEEAALSLTPGAILSSLAMRYLRPVRIGPAVATAQAHGGVSRVEVRDAGSEDRLAVFAVTHTYQDRG